MIGFLDEIRTGTAVLNQLSGRFWLLALAVICLLQYAAHRWRTRRLCREFAAFDAGFQETAGNAVELQRENTITRDENRLLRLFIGQPTARQAAKVLLKRLVPRPRDGFAAVMQFLGDEQRVYCSRGLSETSCGRLTVARDLLDRLEEERFVQLEDGPLYESGLLESLSPTDRGKVRRLWIAAAVDDGQISCLLLTTDMMFNHGDSDRNREIAVWLTTAIAARMARERDFEIQKNQLRLTADMLQLRTIADRVADSPMSMIHEYLSGLLRLLKSDRIAFFLGSVSVLEEATVIRRGEKLPARTAEMWSRYEERLVARYAQRTVPLSVSQAELRRNSIETLIGAALVIPLIKEGRTIAHICCTRRRPEAFAAPERDLAVWAAEDFANTMSRTIRHLTESRHARTDALTKLANRREFDQRIHREWNRARMLGEACTLLMVDLDHFKHVNDSYGHQAGDVVLAEVSRLLCDRLGRRKPTGRDPWDSHDALLARYGGEEIALLLPGMTEDGGLRIAEAIRSTVESAVIEFGGMRIPVTISIGIATFPNHAKTVAELIAAADTALYSAKQAGRNLVVTAAESLPRREIPQENSQAGVT